MSGSDFTPDLSRRLATGSMSVGRPAAPGKPPEPSSAAPAQAPAQERPADDPAAAGKRGAEANEPSAEALRSEVEDLNRMAEKVRREIRFSVDDESGRTVIKVLDADTDKLVRQIPSEQILTLAERLNEGASSLLVDTEA